MDNGTLFYIFGGALAASAVIVCLLGLKLEKFPGRVAPIVALWFIALIGCATTFAVLHSQDEEHHRAGGAPEGLRRSRKLSRNRASRPSSYAGVDAQLSRHHVRLSDERARLRADAGDARLARISTGAIPRGRRRDPLQHLLDPEVGGQPLRRPSRRGQAPEVRIPGGPGRRGRGSLGPVRQGRGVPPLPVCRRRLRARPDPQAGRVPHRGLVERTGLLRVRGLLWSPPGAPRARVPGLGADLPGMQLPLLVLHRSLDERPRGQPRSRRARRRGEEPRRRRRARGDAARPERQQLWPRSPEQVTDRLLRAPRPGRRCRGDRADPLHQPASRRTCART